MRKRLFGALIVVFLLVAASDVSAQKAANSTDYRNAIGLGIVGAVVGAGIGFLTKPQPALGMLATANPDATYQSAIISHIGLYTVIGLVAGALLGALTQMSAKGK